MKPNKLLSVVLTLCVLLAAFSLTALAADGETHSIAVAYCVEGDENGVVEEYAAEDLQNAINEIAETAAMFEATAVKMTLQADVTGVASTLTVPAGTEFTLDLAGHTLEGNNQGNDQAFLLVNGKLTLTDSVGTGKICSTYTGSTGRVVSVVGGELTVAGGTITTEGMAQAGNAIYVSKGSTLSMTGGKVYADAKRGNYAIRIGGRDAVFTMTGGVAEADSSTTETYITAIGVSSTGTVTIGGDSVVRGPEALTTTSMTALTVTGGSFTGEVSAPKNSISGGSFTKAVQPEYCAEGFVPAANADGTYGVKVAPVAKIGTVEYATLADAIAAAAKGSTVTLLADTRENVTIDKALTLDLNGFTLNGGTVKAKPALTITARIVTIKDSSKAQTGTIMREDTAENSGVSSHYVIDIQGNAWVMFESGKVTNNSGSAAGKGAYLVRIGDDSVAKQPGLVIKGGTFTQDNFVVIKVDRGYLTLKGGTLNSTDSYAIENWYSATIKGGTVNGTVAAWTYSDGSNSTLTVEDGTINGNVLSVNYGSAESKVAKVEITGGTVNGALGTYIYSNGLTATEDTSKATIGITGGTFTDDPTKYVTEDSAITANADGTFGVAKAYLAKVGNTSYYTMEEAFKAQTTSGEPVVLLRDYTTGGTFNSGSINRTVDLNGHTWTYTGTNADDAAFKINYPDVTLTVKNGTVVSGSMVGLIPSAMGGTIKYDNSGLVLDGVTATANGNSGIETNGNNTNDTVTLKNSTLNVPNGFGIYFPSSGTLTLDNSTVNAKTMGVQVCAGSLSINEGSAVTVTGDAVPKAENDGAIQDGAAISVVNRTGYKGLGTVTVSGGKFTAKEGNSAIKAYNWANATETAFTENNKVAVSGGSFSSEIKSEYCADGFVPVRNTDGTYTVAEQAKNPFGKTKLLVNRPVMQWKNKDNYSIVIYTGIDSLNYQKAGFVYRIAATLKDEQNVDSGNREMKTTVAYKTIKGTNNKNMPYTYTAKEDFGSEYIYALTFMFPVDRFTSANTTLYVTPFVDTLDGDRVYGKEIVLTEAALSAKGSHLFYNGQ